MLNMKVKSSKNVVYSCKYNILWCPKYRRKVLVDDVERRLKEIIIDITEKQNAEIIKIQIMPDHVHMLVEVDPQYGIHKLIKKLKR
ncbi:unnamed protein product, partial [marine sediment metagenome]